MQRYGYELMQADRDLWLVCKDEDVIPVSGAELKQLLGTPDPKAFADLLIGIRFQPLPGRIWRKV